MSDGSERGRWQRSLEEYCRAMSLQAPNFEPYEIESHQALCLARSGGRTQWGCRVSVGDDRFSSKLYYDFSKIDGAREQAARVALEHYINVIQRRQILISSRTNTQGEGVGSPKSPIQQDPTDLLRVYVASGNHDGVRRAIQEGAKVNPGFLDSNEATPLFIAIGRRDSKAVRIMLEAGADINGNNALEAAIRADSKEILRILLESGADANNGEPLLLAVRRGRKDIVDLLLQKGADVNRGSTLRAAVEYGDIVIIQALLDAGAEVNRADILEAAAERGDKIILQILLDGGMYANDGDILLDAIYKGRKDVVKLLLLAGADVNHNPALAVSSSKGDTELVRILLDAGAGVNIPCTDRPYGSPLVAAIMSGRESIVKTLITAGADVNMQCTGGKYPTPLVAAIRESDTTEKWPGFSRAARSRIIELLLESGADVNLQLADHRCRNALDAALDIKDDIIIRKVLIAGADIANASNGLSITCPWELPDILLSDTEELDIFNVATLTKKKEGVLLATCAEYLESSYGKQGIDIIEGIMCALKDAAGVHVDESIILRATSQQLIARVPTSLEHLLDAVTWLCLTFRQPPPNGPQISTGALTEGRFMFNPWEPLGELTMSDKTCWSPLFDTAVIAFEASTGLNSDWKLEINYQNMIQLAAVEYPVLVDDGIVLMGYSTALIPVRKKGNHTIEWHLEVATHDSQLSVSELTVTKGRWLKTQDLTELRSERNLLGWCPNAKVALGTMQGISDIKRSAARTKHTLWQWTGANLQLVGQSGGPAQVGGQLGLTFCRRMMAVHFNAPNNYLKCLRNSVSEQVIVYDTTQQRAWLIPLVCALHQMLLSYAKHHQLTSCIPQATSGNNNGGLASLEALKRNAVSVIDRSSSLKLTVRDLIMRFSVNLSKTSLQKPTGRKIYGYEFWDIIEDSTHCELKQRQVERQGLAWAPLLGEIKCLFCSNFGDAIIGHRATSVQSPCNRVPAGQDLMTASVCSVNALLERHGASLQVADGSGIFTGSPFEQCSHQGPTNTCWEFPDFLQDIRGSKPGAQKAVIKTDTYPNGAVVFGRSGNRLTDIVQWVNVVIKN